MKYSIRHLVAGSVGAALIAACGGDPSDSPPFCAAPPAPDTAASAPAPAPAASGIVATVPVLLTAEQKKAVIVNDPEILQRGGVDFSLRRTMRQIIETGEGAGKSTPAREEELLGSLLQTYGLTSAVHPVTGHTIPLRPRAERHLDPKSLMDPANDAFHMRPVAVFNRFDLAPADGSTCGEQRQIFEMGPAQGEAGHTPTNRFLLIFEAAIDNPKPEQGLGGCLPLAKFWSDLQGKGNAEIATSLDTLLFKGLPGFKPVVHADHYGNPEGQVRANAFANQVPGVTDPAEVSFAWQLRQFAVRKAAGKTAFSIQPVNDSVRPEIWDDFSRPGDTADLIQLRQAFNTYLMDNGVADILKADRPGMTDTQLIGTVGARIPPQFTGFDSFSTPSPLTGIEDPRALASFRLRFDIEQKIASLGKPAPLQRSVDEVLTRFGVGSCSGCHQLAVGGQIATTINPEVSPTVTWPFTLGAFVHVSGNQVSPLLEERFLPFRFDNLQSFIKEQESKPPAPDCVEKPIVRPVTPSRRLPLEVRQQQAASPTTEHEVQQFRQEQAAKPRRHGGSAPVH